MASSQAQRIPASHPFWQGKRKKVAIALLSAFMGLQLLFLANLSWIYGAELESGTKYHSLNVLFVDYDGGVLGQSLSAAYQKLRADTFPTLISRTTQQYPSPASLRTAVCKGEYWAAIYTHPGASNRLSTALGSPSAAATYNSSDTITYVWNEARYPTVQDGAILSSLSSLVGATTPVYHLLNGTKVLPSIASSPSSVYNVFFNPITATSVNIKPTTQGARGFYNTFSLVMPIIQQFFLLMALNGVSNAFEFYSKMPLKVNGLIRLTISTTYTLLGAICTTGYIWAFREDWAVNAGQYFLTVLVYWLYMHVNFLVIDIGTCFIPASFLSFFILTWAITNTASCVLPFELSAGFYRIGYFFPAHEAYSIFLQIWSGGCNNVLYRALPILFAWEIVGLAGAVYSNRRRCRIAAEMLVKEEAILESPSMSNEVGNPSKEMNEKARRVAEDMTLASSGPSYPQPFMTRLAKTTTV